MRRGSRLIHAVLAALVMMLAFMASAPDSWALAETDEAGATDTDIEQEDERDEQDEDASCASLTTSETPSGGAAGCCSRSNLGPRAGQTRQLFRPPIA